MRLRKGVFSILAIVFLALISVSANKAHAAFFQFGVVTGDVSNSGAPVVGANVAITCNSHTLNTTTNGSGVYFVQYSNTDCPVGQTVTVSAASGSLSGSNTGTMLFGSAFGGVVVDVAVVNVPLVPEFGLMTGAVTSLVSGGLFLLKRRA